MANAAKWQGAIYSANKNRRYSTASNIGACFVPKGNQGKDAEQKSQMRGIPGKAHSRRLEGSFGNEKNHYLLNKVKARTRHTEITWIFLGMLAAKSVNIANEGQKVLHLKR